MGTSNSILKDNFYQVSPYNIFINQIDNLYNIKIIFDSNVIFLGTSKNKPVENKTMFELFEIMDFIEGNFINFLCKNIRIIVPYKYINLYKTFNILINGKLKNNEFVGKLDIDEIKINGTFRNINPFFKIKNNKLSLKNIFDCDFIGKYENEHTIYDGIYNLEGYLIKGSLIDKNKNILYNGVFNKHNIVEGIMIDNNQTKYQGKFIKNKIVEGQIIYSNDILFEGQFKNNKLHCENGKKISGNEQWTGKFINGKFISGIYIDNFGNVFNI